ncbi:MAG: HAD-IC family P-type ATPase, partial [Pseudomonadota bacterium]|nr:HAD-IC family P-type ATPase [Pseudomonadota bacterium]
TTLYTHEIDESELIRLAASIEQDSHHPLAKAIVEEAQRRDLSLSIAFDVNTQAGLGIQGHISGKSILIGNQACLAQANIVLPNDRTDTDTTVHIAINNAYAGTICFADPIKTEAINAIQNLKKQGLQIMLLSGDSEATVTRVAKQTGVDAFKADCLPEEKQNFIKDLQAEGKVVAMVGDGINDAPALAQANIGIAMGDGTQVAMESAGITLVKGNLQTVGHAFRLSHLTDRNIRQNLFFAFVYNSAGIPVAAGLLYPFFGLLLSPMLAAAAMSLSSVCVITNALRLRHIKLELQFAQNDRVYNHRTLVRFLHACS